MKSHFWVHVAGALISAYLLAALVVSFGPPRMRYEPAGTEADIARHLITVVWLGVVWAIIFRPELESMKLSLRSLFALVTIQAFGFWLVRITGF